MAKLKYATIKVNVTFQKVMIWISGLWLFILAILNSFPNVKVDTRLFVHNNTGDNGAIILITAFLFICVATFVRHKIGKLIAGIVFITIAIIGMIGAIITSTKEISTWVIVVGELVAVIGALIWLLEGIGAIRVNKANATNNTTTTKQ
ncbi:MAG: hypothetical protein EIB84_00085 (plasmid) [Spiroplasma poulsonii]|uniref:Uncharacterized protein n=1 Tax=Spiroplasma poulsonii TaxID=2138 RepID=A0A2P6FC98_9MOLU|nr:MULTISPECIES: hypothetical protein [Spiroplasma]KAF0851410.1 putative transmembrane protein [Spiroplasma poulsonii]MBH8623026.1 hypothetical protein [Spiroplasma sp. hyd1]MBW1241321.1 hypothetical protein [Spiroplasma poulsonii]PQM31004.1 hypothetical protein SMSRO_SF008000 [Spiroplasma poulsonii]PWF96000.1 hypothetical protein SMSE_14380 [Spiroplasma poulsonii]